MTTFSGLKFSQKLLLGGFIGSCGVVYLLNGSSFDLQQRRLKDARKLIESGQIPAEAIRVQNGRVIIPPALQNATKSFGEKPFLDHTWTPKFVRDNLILNLANWEQGRWYTIFTSGFNHGGSWHLIANMLSLSAVAPVLISTQGVNTFLGLWLTSAYVGSALTLWTFKSRSQRALDSDPPNHQLARSFAESGAVGASASIFGLFGATAVLFPKVKWQIMFIPYGIPARVLLGFTLIGSVVADAGGYLPSLGHWGHIGGILTGIVFGTVLKTRQRDPRAYMGILAFTAYPAARDFMTNGSKNW